MREEEGTLREEEKRLEKIRIAFRDESNRLEKERLALDSSIREMEGERDALESAIHRSELERSRLEQEKQGLEGERQLLERERSRLEQEEESLENERQLMEEERERLEKARDESHIPQGAFWEVVWPAWDCRAYGSREYWGMLQNIPEGRTELDACMNMPVEIKGVSVRRPDRCAYVEGSSLIHGYWMVDWDQPDCKPWLQDLTDMGCTYPGSGTRRIEAWVVGINDRPQQDWRLLCESMPITWNHVTYNSPSHCEERWEKKFAVWDIPDDRC